MPEVPKVEIIQPPVTLNIPKTAPNNIEIPKTSLKLSKKISKKESIEIVETKPKVIEPTDTWGQIKRPSGPKLASKDNKDNKDNKNNKD